MKNNLRNGTIIGIVIGTLGIGGGIFIANNKSIDIPQIKQEETADDRPLLQHREGRQEGRGRDSPSIRGRLRR